MVQNVGVRRGGLGVGDGGWRMRGKGEDVDAGRQNYKDPARFSSWKLAYEVLVAGNMQRVPGRL